MKKINKWKIKNNVQIILSKQIILKFCFNLEFNIHNTNRKQLSFSLPWVQSPPQSQLQSQSQSQLQHFPPQFVQSQSQQSQWLQIV